MTMDLATNPLGHNKITTTTTTTYKCACDNKIEESFWSHNPGLVKQYGQAESSKTSRTFCWLKLLQIRLHLQKKITYACSKNFSKFAKKLADTPEFVQNYVNKNYDLLYSTPLFHTVWPNLGFCDPKDSSSLIFWSHTPRDKPTTLFLYEQ